MNSTQIGADVIDQTTKKPGRLAGSGLLRPVDEGLDDRPWRAVPAFQLDSPQMTEADPASRLAGHSKTKFREFRTVKGSQWQF